MCLGGLASAGFRTAAVDLSDSDGDLNRLARHESVIEAAKNANARHVYYTSGVRADDDRFENNADHVEPDVIYDGGNELTSTKLEVLQCFP